MRELEFIHISYNDESLRLDMDFKSTLFGMEDLYFLYSGGVGHADVRKIWIQFMVLG